MESKDRKAVLELLITGSLVTLCLFGIIGGCILDDVVEGQTDREAVKKGLIQKVFEAQHRNYVIWVEPGEEDEE
jgi:hypothetical protein